MWKVIKGLGILFYKITAFPKGLTVLKLAKI